MEESRRPSNAVDLTLPENDGMHSLRQKLQEIRTLAISTEEKAKRMHELMMADYAAHRSSFDSPSSPSFPHSGDDAHERPHSPPSADFDPKNPYNIQPGDLDVTFSPLPMNPSDLDASNEDDSEDEPVPDLGCVHYKRNVKLQCYDCRRWFPCRHCHDQAPDLPFPHALNRKKTQNMLCMLCQTPQPAAETCVSCGEYAAWYYCPKCKLWDNDSNKRIYHCDDCGICRVGEGLGKDYVHCRRCNVCISISTSASHPCIERATEGNCPLCLVALFESRTSVVSLPCGHYMHGDCYKDLMAVTYKCPVCSKSAVNMELQWRKLDDEIRAQPMPEDDAELDGLLPQTEGPVDDPTPDPAAASHDGTVPAPGAQQRRSRTVWVACNDCGSRSWAPFHWLGLKCQTCDSYNTNQMAPSAGHETEAERVMRQQHVPAYHDFTGDAVMRDAGITAAATVASPDGTSRADSALDVPHSPSGVVPSSPTMPASTASTAQSPGRYFVRDDVPRRPSFTASRFSAPSISSLPTLADMPRMPRMPNIELPRFSPYEMINAVSRSLSPMRYYLQGLDLRDDSGSGSGSASHDDSSSAHASGRTGARRVRPRPKSVQTAPVLSPLASHARPRSAGSADLHSWDEEVFDESGGSGGRPRALLDEDEDLRDGEGLSGDSEDDDSMEDDEDEDDADDDDDLDDREEIDIFGHR